MSNNCQKLDIFSKKLPKIFIFSKKKRKFLAIFWKKMKMFGNFFFKVSSFWQLFDIQMAIFQRVRCSFPPKTHTTILTSTFLQTFCIISMTDQCLITKVITEYRKILRVQINTAHKIHRAEDKNFKNAMSKVFEYFPQINENLVLAPLMNIKMNKINNKAISMMRGKSPRSDVEMSKKLNFLAAIFDFWWPFLKQF